MKRTHILYSIVLTVLFAILYLGQCQKTNKNKQTYNQNEKALQKEIFTQKNKNNQLQSSVVMWKGKAKELDNYSKDLYNELTAVKKSKVKIITKTELTIKTDSIIIDNTASSLGQNQYQLNWSYNDSIRTIEGYSKFFAQLDNNKLKITPDKTTITKNEISIVLIAGVKLNKKTGHDEIFVTPKTKGITITSLEGAEINPTKKKRFALSLGIGYGIILKEDITFNPNINLSITKTLIRF